MHPLLLLLPAAVCLAAAGFLAATLRTDLRAGTLEWDERETALGAVISAGCLLAGLIAAWGALA